jgi:hypothetical protein
MIKLKRNDRYEDEFYIVNEEPEGYFLTRKELRELFEEIQSLDDDGDEVGFKYDDFDGWLESKEIRNEKAE